MDLYDELDLYKLEQSQLQEQLKMHYECSNPLIKANELFLEKKYLKKKLQQLAKSSNQLRTFMKRNCLNF